MDDEASGFNINNLNNNICIGVLRNELVIFTMKNYVIKPSLGFSV